MFPMKSFDGVRWKKLRASIPGVTAGHEIEVFKEASRLGPLRADDLADKMSRERSTVYRALQRLMSCGMCYRETKSLEKGGYYHVYSAVSKDILKMKMEHCVEEWHKRMQEALARFDEHMF
jgi:predicted transcriptional regulator